MTPELRFGLYKVNPNELGADYVSSEIFQKPTHPFCSFHIFSTQMDAYEKQASLDLKRGIIEPDEGILEQLKCFGLNEHAIRKALVATRNAGMDQALDYIKQHENDPGFSEPPVVEKRKRKPRYIPLELQRLFVQMQELDQRAISTEGII